MKKRNETFKWVFIAGLFTLIAFIGVKNYFDKKNILENPYETVATITGIKGCFKNGRCITYRYSYNDEIYKKEVRVSWGFSNWCKDKGNCIGFQFKLLINKENPEKVFANWEEVFDDKNFINYP